MKSKDQLDETLDEMAKVLKPILIVIHAQAPTTQNYYGEYMSTITTVADMDKHSTDRAKVMLGIGVAMQRAGANKAGVASALRVMGVI